MEVIDQQQVADDEFLMSLSVSTYSAVAASASLSVEHYANINKFKKIK